MAKVWKITKYDGLEVVGEWTVSVSLSQSEICKLMERLVATTLSEDEIIAGSLRRNHRGYQPYFERSVRGNPISYGENPHFTAAIVDA